MPEKPCDAVPFAPPDIGEDEIAAVVDALRSGWLTTGPNAAAFEAEFAEALRTGFGEVGSGLAKGADWDGPIYAVAVNSATAGLHLALEALGIGPGDEVLVPTWTFTATAEVVRYLGADPVLVDCDPSTLNIDLRRAASLVTSATRAILPVHFAGLPVDRGELTAFAQAHDVAVVEDAAHAFPVHSTGLPVGLGASQAVVFSFYATKTMTTGEGGMLVTPVEGLARRARTMRLHGISRDVFDRYTRGGSGWAYDVVAPGFKYNLTDPAAAMGRVQLRRAPAMRQSRAAIAQRYHEELRGLPLQLPARAPDRGPAASGGTDASRGADEHAWHLYVIRLTDDAPISRDAFIERMAAEHGVSTSVHFIPLHRHPYWRETCAPAADAFQCADDAFARTVSLPIFSAMTDAQVDRVVAAARALLTAPSRARADA